MIFSSNLCTMLWEARVWTDHYTKWADPVREIISSILKKICDVTQIMQICIVCLFTSVMVLQLSLLSSLSNKVKRCYGSFRKRNGLAACVIYVFAWRRPHHMIVVRVFLKNNCVCLFTNIFALHCYFYTLIYKIQVLCSLYLSKS